MLEKIVTRTRDTICSVCRLFDIRTTIAIGLPLLLYGRLSLMLSHWLIDDAGISFVYARNLATGHGLVSQPGMLPVEGYSNFLWVVLQVPFFLIGAFEPYLTPKLLSLALVGLTFWCLHRMLRIVCGASFWPSLVALILLSLNASFVIWTSSGLENALYAAGLTTLAYILVRHGQKQQSDLRLVGLAALAAFAVAITRPDGILFGIVPVAIWVLDRLWSNRRDWESTGKTLSVYTTILGVALASFVLFRWMYFGDLLPNTYYVKGGPTIATAVDAVSLQGVYLEKLRELLTSIAGIQLWFPVLLVILAFVFTTLSNLKQSRAGHAVMLMLLVALLDYLILPNDYMREFRFATPFLVFVYPAAVLFFVQLTSGLNHHKRLRVGFLATAAVVGVALTLSIHYPRVQMFAKNPTVAFERIAQRYGHQFNDYADRLGLDEASFLVPDIGGTLYYSRLKIYDLAGLCDQVISRTRGKNQAAFYDYVFDSLKPTFIHTHGYFTGVSKFDDDPRFLRDYVPIRQYADEYVNRVYHAKRISGDFVRLDQVSGRESQLDSLRQGLEK